MTQSSSQVYHDKELYRSVEEFNNLRQLILGEKIYIRRLLSVSRVIPAALQDIPTGAGGRLFISVYQSQ